MKTFLSLTFAGALLAGSMVGTLVEGTDEPIRQSVLPGLGVWMTIIGIVAFLPAR